MKLLTNNFIFTASCAAVVLFLYVILHDVIDVTLILKAGVIYLFAHLMNALCKRYQIIGKETHMPLLLICLLSVFYIDMPLWQIVVQGSIWSIAFSLPLASALEEWKSEKYLIYCGILIGIAQLFDNRAVLLFIPLLAFFLFTGARKLKAIIMSFSYFFMIILCYIGISFVIDNIRELPKLVPSFVLDFSLFNTVNYRLLLPFIIILILAHTITFSAYKFRYPNLMKNINRALLVQAALFALILFVTADTKLVFYLSMPLAIILSIAFSYKHHLDITSVAFATLVIVCFTTMYLNNAVVFG